MLDKLSLKAKLALVAAVPIVVMLVLGINGAWQKHADYKKQEQADTLSRLVVNLGEVVHELQKERGISAGFMSSQGAKFADSLTAQRKLTDENISRLQQSIGLIDRSFVGPMLHQAVGNCRGASFRIGKESRANLSTCSAS